MAGRIRSIEKSNDLIEYLTQDLPASRTNNATACTPEETVRIFMKSSASDSILGGSLDTTV
jgi:hypothetical protein